MNDMVHPKSDYSISILLNSNPDAVFKALSEELGEWWGDMDNPVKKKGDVFTISWGEPWYRFKTVDYNPNKNLTWECIDANQKIGGMEGVEKEWVGTKLHWAIRKTSPNQVQLNVIHEGLVPEFRCYDVCSSAWNDFISSNLKKYLER